MTNETNVNDKHKCDAGATSIAMTFVGDICLAGGMQPTIRDFGPDHPFSAVSKAFKTANIVVGNLECCISEKNDDGSDPPKNVMTIPADLALGLATSGVNVVCLSNNHILDGGIVGLTSTFEFLDRHNIKYFGAGRNLEEAECPLFMEINGLKIAFLGACDAPVVYGTASKCGVPPLDAKRLSQRVLKCKKEADVVVVSIHADLEFSPYPSPSRVRLSRWLVHQGADLIIQHHPHVCQGVERHGDGLIAYSLGNFVFNVHGNEYLNRHAGTDWGLILHVFIERQRSNRDIKYQLVPVTIGASNQVAASKGEQRERQLRLLAEFSHGLADWRVIRRARMKRCVAELRMQAFGLYYLWRRRGLVTAVREVIRVLQSAYERRWMYSLLSMGIFG